jgi:hypothetical protein
MHVASPILLLLGGAVGGIAFLISCGDNLHLSADAAGDAPTVIDAPEATDASLTCDCPAVERPLAGRFVVFSQFVTVPSNHFGFQSVACPAGTTLIWGSCTTDVVTPIRNVTLQESGFYDVPPTAWGCTFHNNEATPVTIRVSVICLKPTL